jgi:hypothetical protein
MNTDVRRFSLFICGNPCASVANIELCFVFIQKWYKEEKMKRIALAISLALSCILAFPIIISAADIGLKGIGGKVTLVLPEDPMDSTIGIGVLADLGIIIPQLKAEASLDYWGNSYDTFGVDTSWRSIAIGGTAKYHFPFSGNISPFTGGGIEFIFSRAKVEIPATTFLGVATDGGSSSESDTDVGFHLVGGVDIPIAPNIKLSAEAKYAVDGADSFQIGGALVYKLE